MRFALCTLGLMCAVASVACSEEKPLPMTPACTLTVTVPVTAFGGGGGTGTAAVAAASGCAWTATSEAAWISITGGATGTGAGTVAFTVAAYAGDQPRGGTLRVAGQTVTVTQAACDVRPRQSELTFGDAAGQSTLDIDAESGCAWTLAGAPPWLAVDPASGTGPARVALRVTENSGDAREAELRLNGHAIRVRQAAEPCSFDVRPVFSLVPSAGGTGTFTVTTGAACSWTIANSHPFVRVATGTQLGTATIPWEMDRNPEGFVTDFRKAEIEIRWDATPSGQNLRLWQFGDCRTAFTAAGGGGFISEIAFDAAGDTKTIVTLTDSPFTCPWRVEGGADWLTATPFARLQRPDDPPDVRRGDGDVRITVTANPSTQPRRATIVIGERALTIVQNGQ